MMIMILIFNFVLIINIFITFMYKQKNILHYNIFFYDYQLIYNINGKNNR